MTTDYVKSDSVKKSAKAPSSKRCSAIITVGFGEKALFEKRQVLQTKVMEAVQNGLTVSPT